MVLAVLGLSACGHVLLRRGDTETRGRGDNLRRGDTETRGRGDEEKSNTSPNATPKATVQAAFGKLPLYFIENQGQLDEQVAYYVQGRDTTLYFTPQGLTFTLSSSAPLPQGQRKSSGATLQPVALSLQPHQDRARQRWVIKLDFVGANPQIIGTPLILSNPDPRLILNPALGPLRQEVWRLFRFDAASQESREYWVVVVFFPPGVEEAMVPLYNGHSRAAQGFRAGGVGV